MGGLPVFDVDFRPQLSQFVHHGIAYEVMVPRCGKIIATDCANSTSPRRRCGNLSHDSRRNIGSASSRTDPRVINAVNSNGSNWPIWPNALSSRKKPRLPSRIRRFFWRRSMGLNARPMRRCLLATTRTPTSPDSTEFATGRSGVAAILAEYLRRDSTEFAAARHGIALDHEERRRRFVILSLLQREGLDRHDYARRFAGDVLEHLPQIADLEPLELAVVTPGAIRLTDDGIERSDAIGPWLYSSQVTALMDACECR